MPQRALDPFAAASALLTEAGGQRALVAEQAWAQLDRFREEQGEDSPAAAYWRLVFQIINDRQEIPTVPDAPAPTRKRFDALGRVTTDALPAIHLSTE